MNKLLNQNVITLSVMHESKPSSLNWLRTGRD
jgi:hypothetical protein